MHPARVLALALLLGTPAAVFPQTPDRSASPPAMEAAAPQEAPRRQARRSEEDEDMVRAAREVLALIDAGRAEEVWEGASPVVRRMVPSAEFLMQLAADRRRLGAVVARGEPVVDHERYPAGGRVPQGEYVNVAFPTRFGNVEAPVRELVSFRLDEDRVWRVSGYSVR